MNNVKTHAVLRMSNVYAPTLKEDPSDADIQSAKLLTRAGMLRKEAAGLYSFLPLGMRVMRKIETIIREECDAEDAQEILMPFVQPAELWQKSGRWNVYGAELLRVNDRHDNEFCLGPTHEEIITDLVNNELRSYKNLPKNLYQIQIKFRDERRPRFGLLRGREFMMKDGYSFDADEAGLDVSYQKMRVAYSKIFDRIGIDYRIVDADSGQIGGSGSEEFMALADAGEAELVYCDCGYAADVEAAPVEAHPQMFEIDHMEKIATPGVHTIAELAEFMHCEESATVKALAVMNEAEEIWILFVPGDREVNEVKAENLIGAYENLTDEQLINAGLKKGSIGCVGLPEGIHVAADKSLQNLERWLVGANDDGYHIAGAKLGEDFTIDTWADLCVVREGDACPCCGKELSAARGIECGQIFKLGTKYSEAMNATFMAEDGSEKNFVMGCYGIGVSRTVAAIAEQCHDEHGIIWPAGVAPAHIVVIPLTVNDEEVHPAAEKIAADLAAEGYEVVIDDRKERPGVKFADNDLIGWPVQIVVGKRGLAEGNVEIKKRATGEKTSVALDGISEFVDALFA